MRKSNFLIALISLAILIVAGCEDPELGIIETGIIGASNTEIYASVHLTVSQAGVPIFDEDVAITSDFQVVILRELEPDTGYAVVITAYNENDSLLYYGEQTGITLSAGDEHVVNFLVKMGSFPPSNLTATAVSESQIDLSWTDNALDEDGYVISRKTGTAYFAVYDTVDANVITYSDTGLNESTTYSYRVFAFNYVGNSGFSNSASATTMATIPAAPSNQWAKFDETIEVKWKDNSFNEEGFRIQRKSLTSGVFEVIGENEANDTIYVDETIELGETYFYKVCAFNSRGESEYSGEAKTTSLSLVGSLNLPGSSFALQLAGNYAYVTTSYGLRVFDVSDPFNPDTVAFLAYNYALDVAISNDQQYAYVTNYSNSNVFAGLHVIDISTPDNPVEVGLFSMFSAIAVDVNDDDSYIYVTSYDLSFGNVRVIDVSDPTNPVQSGEISLGLGQPADISYQDNYCYIGCGIEGMRVMDVMNPASPDTVGIYSGLPIAWGVCVDANYVYLSGGFTINIVDITNPLNPYCNNWVYNAPLNARDVTRYGNRLFVPDMNLGDFFVADVTTRTAPKTLGKMTIEIENSSPARVVVDEPYAYVIDVVGFRVLFVGEY